MYGRMTTAELRIRKVMSQLRLTNHWPEAKTDSRFRVKAEDVDATTSSYWSGGMGLRADELGGELKFQHVAFGRLRPLPVAILLLCRFQGIQRQRSAPQPIDDHFFAQVFDKLRRVHF